MMIGLLNLACWLSQNDSQLSNTAVPSKCLITSEQLVKEKKKSFQSPYVEFERVSLESVMAEFHLSTRTLKRMMEQMSNDMEKGLEGGLQKSTIAMLPSFVPKLPDGSERGRFIAMDLGGTNLRVMLMEIEPGKKLMSKQFNTRIPNAAMHGTGEQLFDFIVKCLGDFLEEHNLAQEALSLGFTFSYPCVQSSLRSATLLRWTKGFAASGVVGRDVVCLLEEAIQRHGGISVKVVALINDTVGTMVAAAAQNNGVCHLAVIIATGTNASYMEKSKNVKFGLANASDPYMHDEMIIDTEWGGFGDNSEANYIVTRYDRLVDSRSEHPGVNVFDKLVAGMYMGELVRLVLEKLAKAEIVFRGLIQDDPLFQPDSFPTKYISEILGDESGSYVNTRQILGELGVDDYSFSDMLLLREVCMVVSRRSANLAAAAIASVLNRVRHPRMVVGIDGSTYKYLPFYHFWVTDKLRELVEPGLEFEVIQTEDGSGKGAALVAAIAETVQNADKISTERSDTFEKRRTATIS